MATSLNSNAICGESVSVAAANGALACASPIFGRYVTLENSSPAQFQFAEVKVMASGERRYSCFSFNYFH